jgi:hypothetical protein
MGRPSRAWIHAEAHATGTRTRRRVSAALPGQLAAVRNISRLPLFRERGTVGRDSESVSSLPRRWRAAWVDRAERAVSSSVGKGPDVAREYLCDSAVAIGWDRDQVTVYERGGHVTAADRENSREGPAADAASPYFRAAARLLQLIVESARPGYWLRSTVQTCLMPGTTQFPAAPTRRPALNEGVITHPVRTPAA